MEDYKSLNFGSFSFNNDISLDKNIIELLKGSIFDDEKIYYINGATDFYEDLYEIINNLFGKDFICNLSKDLKMLLIIKI